MARYGYYTDEDLQQRSYQSDYSRIGSIYFYLAEKFYPAYDTYLSSRSEFISRTERNLIKADISTPIEIYFSAAIGIGFVLGFITSAVAFQQFTWDLAAALIPDGLSPGLSMLDLIFALGISVPAWALITVGVATLFGIGGAIISVYFALLYPRYYIRKRENEIRIILPDAISFMYCLSTSGMNRLDILRSLAAADDTYGEVAVEFRRIVHRMDNFSEDYQTAITNVAETTPNDRLGKFLSDLISIINSGGDIQDFLYEQKEAFLSETENRLESQLDTKEALAEMYITISLFPILGMILLSIVSVLSVGFGTILFLLIYLGIPFLAGAFILIASGYVTNNVGSGTLEPDDNHVTLVMNDEQNKVLSGGITEDFRHFGPIFEQIYLNEIRRRVFQFLHEPLNYIRTSPNKTFIFTIPAILLFYIGVLITQSYPRSFLELLDNNVLYTFSLVYIPLMIALVPYVALLEWGRYKRGKITDDLTVHLRKLANTNETGQTLRESFRITAEDGNSVLTDELETMYKKVEFGLSLDHAIIESNNKYNIPRLARIFRIIKSAQNISSNISPVLKTAAQLSEAQDEIEKQRKKRSRNQTTVILITYAMFAITSGMMGLFITDIMTELSSLDTTNVGFSGLGSGLGTDTLDMLYFHGLFLHGIVSGIIASYLRTAKITPGAKYVIGLSTITMLIGYYLYV